MTREEVKLDFVGSTHEHFGIPSTAHLSNGQPKQQHQENKQQMNTLNGLSELNSKMNASRNQCGQEATNEAALSTIAILRRHPMYDSLVLVKRYNSNLNGFILELPTSELNSGKREQNLKSNECNRNKLISVYLDGDDPIYQSEQEKYNNNKMEDGCELVYVPMNGLIDRLDNYSKQDVAIDSRVYAFAMGLKTAERFLTSSSMKEIQETPPL